MFSTCCLGLQNRGNVLCNIYGSCKIHGIICGAWHLLWFPTEAPSLDRSANPSRGSFPTQRSGLGLSWMAPSLGIWVSGGIRTPSKDTQKYISLPCIHSESSHCPVLTFFMCLVEAGRNQCSGEECEDGKHGGEAVPQETLPLSLLPSLHPSLPSCII